MGSGTLVPGGREAVRRRELEREGLPRRRKGSSGSLGSPARRDSLMSKYPRRRRSRPAAGWLSLESSSETPARACAARLLLGRGGVWMGRRRATACQRAGDGLAGRCCRTLCLRPYACRRRHPHRSSNRVRCSVIVSRLLLSESHLCEVDNTQGPGRTLRRRFARNAWGQRARWQHNANSMVLSWVWS